MFIDRLNHFACDGDCDKKDVAVKKYPKGWIQTRERNQPVKHYCKDCQTKLPDGVKKYVEGQKH